MSFWILRLVAHQITFLEMFEFFSSFFKNFVIWELEFSVQIAPFFLLGAGDDLHRNKTRTTFRDVVVFFISKEWGSI
jgi:hypothetical protein